MGLRSPRRPPELGTIRLCYRVAMDAFYRFNADDGWAIASHIALSILMALFPFLILVTAIAGFIGSRNLADEVARLIVATWPQQVSAPIAGEIQRRAHHRARRHSHSRLRVRRLFRLERH